MCTERQNTKVKVEVLIIYFAFIPNNHICIYFAVMQQIQGTSVELYDNNKKGQNVQPEGLCDTWKCLQYLLRKMSVYKMEKQH